MLTVITLIATVIRVSMIQLLSVLRHTLRRRRSCDSRAVQ